MKQLFQIASLCLIGTLALTLALSHSTSVKAADDTCLQELKSLMKTFDDQIPNSRVNTTIIRDGQTLQEQRGAYLDEKNFINESLRHNYWTMVRERTEYRSRDGKQWEKHIVRTPDWAERARIYGAKMIEEVSNAKCGETEELDGKTYKIYTYTHTATEPTPVKTENKIYIDPDTGWRYRWISTLIETKPHTILTNTFVKDDNITLPDPNLKPKK